MSTNTFNRVVVIGAGFAGLAAAIRLQARGMRVTLLEKREMAGGRAYQLKKGGYTFDMGPSLLTEPDIIRDVFQSAGKKMEDYVDLERLDPYYRIYFHDNSHLDYSGDTALIKEQMSLYNKKDADNYESFMKLSEKLYNVVINQGLGRQPLDTWSKMISVAPQALKLNALSPAFNTVKKYFSDFRHRFMFSFHPLFIGGNPFKAPALYLMIPHMEKEGGVWYAKGGMYSVIQALVKVFCELGGLILYNSAVTSIEIENGIGVGVFCGNRFYPADIIVSNSDFHFTYKELIKKEYRKKWTDQKLDKLNYSMSAFILYLGVRKKYKRLLHHTIILSKRYKKLVDDIFDNNILPADFSLYLHTPTKTDPSMAPEGCESIYVLAPVTNMKANVNWETEKEKYADKIISFLERDFGLEGLKDAIEVKEMMTPQDFATTQNAYLGSAWGVEPRLMQSAYFRPHNQSEDIENLFLVGASTHPGAGVPGVLLTVQATEKAILEYLDYIQKTKLTA
jgi:phytoene desaturase